MTEAVSATTNGASATGPGPHPTKLRSYAPASGDVLGEAPNTTPDEVRLAVARARRAQEAWAALPVEERGRRLLTFRNAIVERSDEVVDLLVRECGKPRQEALLHEVALVSDLITYYVKTAPRVLGPRHLSLHLMRHRKSFLHYVPRGVVGIISPWNYPFQIPLRDAVTALIAGNAVVHKPSELTPLVGLKAKEIWDGAGLPEDLFQVTPGFAPTGAALIDSNIQFLVFTGAVSTGKRVAAACGERLIPCIMELGGKAPLIACGDAEIERTARHIVYGGFVNSGQACIAVERVYAHRDVHDKLLERVVDLTKSLKQGDPAKEFVDIGAMTHAPQIAVLEELIADAIAKGAAVMIGGRRVRSDGQFFEPTILSHCTHAMSVMTKEIFGPVIPFMKVASDEDAIRLANESDLGLNAYVYSTDRDHGRRLAQRLEVGSALVNDVLSNAGTVEAPFGGTKQSGFGRAMGDDALREMCSVRHISVERLALGKDPFGFPYIERNYLWFRKALKVMFGGGGAVKRVSELF